MAGDLDIDGRLLPGDLRGLLGMPADVPAVPSPQNLYAPTDQPAPAPQIGNASPDQVMSPQARQYLLGEADTSGGKPTLTKAYQTALTPDEESGFQRWVHANNVPFDPSAKSDYDMRGFFKALQSGDERATTAVNAGDGQMHFPDTWKTPYHKTVSNESMYAPPNAPRWDGDVLRGPDGKVIADERSAAEKAKGPPPSGLRMPTLAETTAMQQRAAQDELGANALATDTAVRQATDLDTVNKQATVDLQNNIKAQQEWQAKSDKVRADKEAAAAAIIKEVDGFKIDPHKYWHDAGTAKQVGWFIAMALSGIGDAMQHKSGPNPVIAMLDSAVDRSLKLQMDQRDQLKEKMGRANADVDKWDRFSSNKDAQFLAQRAQAKELVAQQLITASSKYGAQAAIANGAKTAADIRKSAAKDLQQSVDMAHGHTMQEEQIKISKQQAAAAAASAAASARHAALEERKFEYQQKHDQDVLDMQASELAQKGQLAEAKAVKANGIGGVAVQVTNDKGEVVGVRQDLMRNKDGSAFTIDDPTERRETRKVKAATDTLLHLMDEARRLRTGWTTATGNSDEFQQLQADWSTAKVVAKDLLGLGVIAGPDMDLIDGFLGTGDPTKWKSPEAGIKQARQNVLRVANDKFHAAGFDGDYAPADLGAPAAARNSAEQEKYNELLQSDSGTRQDTIGKKAWTVPTIGPIARLAEHGIRAATGNLRSPIDDREEQMLQVWTQWLKDPDRSAQGISFLKGLAENASSPGIRERAHELAYGGNNVSQKFDREGLDSEPVR